MLPSHQAVPLTFYNKIALMSTKVLQRNAWDEAAKLIGRGLPMLQIKRAFHCFAGRFLELFILFYKNGIVSGNG